MPAVTVFSKPNGEPIAITHSPTLRRFTSPIFTAGKPVASILITATSVRLSEPMILALNSRLSVKVTKTSSAPSTTCALVITKPSVLKMKPEPTPRGWSSRDSGTRRFGVLGSDFSALGSAFGSALGAPGMRSPKNLRSSSWMSSSDSEPLPPPIPPRLLAFSMVRIFTTEGPTWSTNSVKSGKPRTCAAVCNGSKKAPANAKTAVLASKFLKNFIVVVPINLKNQIENTKKYKVNLLFTLQLLRKDLQRGRGHLAYRCEPPIVQAFC